jgi:hypothetical protein
MRVGIIGAHRPTTTTSIRSLIEQGRIAREDDRRYVLLGDPPDWFRERAPVVEYEV